MPKDNGGVKASGLFGGLFGKAGDLRGVNGEGLDIQAFVDRLEQMIQNAPRGGFSVMGPAMLRHIADKMEEDGVPCKCGFVAALELLKIAADKGGFENYPELLAMYLAREASVAVRPENAAELQAWMFTEQLKSDLEKIPDLHEEAVAKYGQEFDFPPQPFDAAGGAESEDGGGQ